MLTSEGKLHLRIIVWLEGTTDVLLTDQSKNETRSESGEEIHRLGNEKRKKKNNNRVSMSNIV